MAAKNKADTSYLAPLPGGGLAWGPLTEGVLVRRYKRFLADVLLPDGRTITAHTANTGSMRGCSEPGRPVWLSWHGDRPGRKYPYSLEMIRMPGGLVGINTGIPNRLVRAAALAGVIPEFGRVARAKSEVAFGASRLDLRLTGEDGATTLVEIKNCSLAEDRTALFPDAVTERGRKHLGELAALAESGVRAVLFLLVQRADADRFRPADHIDPLWGKALRAAAGKGVEAIAYRADLDLAGIRMGSRLPVELQDRVA